jgi:glucose-6-phosphate dehydrogenase assembly protein OpcA
MGADFEPGLPVEIGRIDKELGKLWESSDDTKTRASLINFVVYTEDPASIAADTEMISAVAGKHACRAILILANPRAKESGAKAWINAHCHIVGKGRQICSEQITFRLDGDSAAALPNIVFSHLDSDLPLCLWWKADFPEPLDEKLWSWVDRVVYDSAAWRNPAHQFSLVRHISSSDNNGIVLCDLNWTRLFPWRFALAGMFDHSAALPCLARIEKLSISAGPAGKTAALLLAGWFADRLGWELAPDGLSFLAPGRGKVDLELESGSGGGLESVSIHCGDATFRLRIAENPEFFESTMHMPGIPEIRELAPAPRGKLDETLLRELSRAGRHKLYMKSLDIVLRLVGR